MNFNFFNKQWSSEIHTKWDNSWYDNAYFGPDGVEIKSDRIDLCIKEIPRRFKKPDIYEVETGGQIKEWCCGELIGEECSYGTYTWQVKMPSAPGLWPALWLCGAKSWPPEIDLIEGYTRKKGGYVKNIFSTKLETNAHYRKELKNGTHIALGAKAIPTIIYWLYKRDIDEYKLIWHKDYISMYFNGYRIRTIKDKNLLNDLNDKALMYPIMNIMVTNDFKFDKNQINQYSLKVYKFEYKPFSTKMLFYNGENIN